MQTLGGGCLLVERLVGLSNDLRILHRDDRLSREILQQRDLLVGERADFPAVDANLAEDLIVLSKRDGQQGSHAGQFDGATQRWPSGKVDRVLLDIGEIDNVCTINDSLLCDTARHRKRTDALRPLDKTRIALGGNHLENFAIVGLEASKACST